MESKLIGMKLKRKDKDASLPYRLEVLDLILSETEEHIENRNNSEFKKILYFYKCICKGNDNDMHIYEIGYISDYYAIDF